MSGESTLFIRGFEEEWKEGGEEKTAISFDSSSECRISDS